MYSNSDIIIICVVSYLTVSKVLSQHGPFRSAPSVRNHGKKSGFKVRERCFQKESCNRQVGEVRSTERDLCRQRIWIEPWKSGDRIQRGQTLNAVVCFSIVTQPLFYYMQGNV